VTPTLESALSGLPAKPRVHELSKRIGISNKELLAALAERGHTVSSASSSVPLAIARSVIEDLLGGRTNGGSSPEDAVTGAAAAEQVAADIPGDTPGHGGHAINPLFLPPAAQQDGTEDGARDAADTEDSGQPARSGNSRRRRGRSGSGRRGAQGADAETGEEQVPAPAAVADETNGAPAADVVAGDTEPDPTDTERQGEAADTDTDTETETDDDASARGRRRRRGRRGRGRVSDTDDRDGDRGADRGEAQPENADSAADAQPVTEAAGATEGEAGSSDGDATDDDEQDGESDTDTDTDTGSGTGSAANRRRRRRRRRSTGDETPREDDPDNTVVHVREPRLSQSASAGSSGSASNEVQGVRGSTRLEAKRQRRRDSRDSSRRRPQILTEAEFLARRESVERVMAVRQRGDLAQVALLEDGILVEHFVSQAGSDSMIGSVFLGKVQNVLPSMEAAFVDIGRGRNAVIYAGEVNWDAAGLNGKARRIETALSSGDTILAQVSKDPVGHKGARLTTQISLPGRFVVYVPGGGATGISRKLPDTERKRLKSIMDRIVPDDAGVIIRTAAEGIAEEELARDVERLTSQWAEITRRAAEKTSAPTQLYAEPGTLIKVVRDLFNSDISRLVVDGDDAYGPVADYVTAVAPELADRLVRYESATPNGPDVFAAYRIDEQILKALERKVHLPSGGSLVIDRTEAMTVVDVNTGKYTGSGGNLEETVTKNNLEAAEEMVRQLRLRDIGGIIVIDFIDMVLESNRELVLRRLTEALGRDRTRHQVAEVTSLGLVQMTRKRMGTGLVEAFSEPCPHCGGRGIVLHDLPMVATAVEDTGPERRNGKGRRGRGRDTDRAEDILVPRVVEVPAGRRPDPRGPKPPSLGSVDQERATSTAQGAIDGDPGDGDSGRSDSGRSDAGRGDSGRGGRGSGRRRAVRREGPSDVGADELDWIAAVARAGIAAAEDADSDDFEAGSSESVESDVEPIDVDEIIVEIGEPVETDAQDITTERAATDGSTIVDEQAGPTASEPDDDQVAPEPQRRRRGRRSAGRPAGAPLAAQAVDIVVQEPTPQTDHQSPNGDAASAGNGSDGQGAPAGGSAGNGAPDNRGAEPGGDIVGAGHDGADNGAEVADTTPAAPRTPPRRRRAASRPAGPAAGPTPGEPVVVTVPVDQPAT